MSEMWECGVENRAVSGRLMARRWTCRLIGSKMFAHLRRFAENGVTSMTRITLLDGWVSI